MVHFASCQRCQSSVLSGFSSVFNRPSTEWNLNRWPFGVNHPFGAPERRQEAAVDLGLSLALHLSAARPKEALAG